MFYTRNFQGYIAQKKLAGQNKMIPPDKYIEIYKKIYEKYKCSNGPLTINELKKFAIEEAKKASSTLKLNNKKSFLKNNSNKLLDKNDLVKLLKTLFDIMDPYLVKINHNFKNERRPFFSENNEKYFETIKIYEKHKSDLLHYVLKNLCKKMNLTQEIVSKSVFHYIQIKDEDLINTINSFTKVGRIFSMAPNRLSVDEIIQILKLYLDNLTFMMSKSNDKSECSYAKYSLIIINDLIFMNHGREEEQIYNYIEKNKLEENIEIKQLLSNIKKVINDNINLLFVI